MGFVDSYMVQVKEICDRLDMDRIAEMVAALSFSPRLADG